MKKTICIFLSSLNTGGAEVISVEIANFLVKYYNVIVISAFMTDELDENEESSNFLLGDIDENIKVIFLTKKSKSECTHEFYVDQLRKVVKMEKINLLISTGTNADAIVADVSPRTFKWIAMAHGPYDVFSKGSVEYSTAQRVLDSVNKFIYLTEGQISKYKCDNSKLLKIDNFSSRRVESHPKFEKFTFCLVSRAHIDKGWQEVYLASKTLIENGHDICIAFIGEGTEYKKLSRANKHPNIIFYGYQKNPERIIAKCHAGILVSKYEQQPLTVIDYINNGIPVITSSAGGCPEMITSETGKRCGIVVEYGNIEQLINAMKCMVYDHEAYSSFTDVTHKVKNKFSKDLYMETILNTVSNLL